MTAQDTVDLTVTAAGDLSEQVIAIHARLQQLGDLEPGPVVNAVFTDLVRLCEYRHEDDPRQVLADRRIVDLLPQLRQFSAHGEYLLERHWARRIVAAADPLTQLERFPYLGNYQQLTTLELHSLAAVGVDLGRLRRLCFLGGGPLPLSALLISRQLSVPVDVVDLDAEATVLAGQVRARVGPADVHFHHGEAGQFDRAEDSQVVVLAALVGLDRPAKRKVLAALAARMPPGSVLIARSAHGLRTLLYPSLELGDLGEWQPLSVVRPLNAVVNSVVIAVRR